MTTPLPDTLPGHWDTPEGRAMAEEYANEPREKLPFGSTSDFAFANWQYMAFPDSLDLEARQDAAKQRIRWLSVQLAKANLRLETLTSRAATVMQMLDEDGPKVVPHLIDTDDNAGQRLREAIADARATLL